MRKKEQSILFADSSADERIQMLENNAYEVLQNFSFTRQMTEDELKEARENFVAKSLELKKIQDELDEIKQRFKMTMKPMVLEHEVILKSLKYKSVDRCETVYLMDNREEQVMEYYDRFGIQITTRPFNSDERQLKMKISKTGTND